MSDEDIINWMMIPQPGNRSLPEDGIVEPPPKPIGLVYGIGFHSAVVRCVTSTRRCG